MCSPNCIEFIRSNLSVFEALGKRVLEVGSYDVNGSPAPMVRSWGPAEYIGVDIQPGPKVDVLCAAEDLVEHFGAESFDVVISTEMLEHILDWPKAISNLKRVCKKDGLILLTTRSKGFAWHPHPVDYWRFESEDFAAIFADFIRGSVEEDIYDPGVFIRAQKPKDFQEADLSGYALYSIMLDRRATLQEFLENR